MYFTVYKTTNNITGQIYIGQHRTIDLDDGYLGSGTRLTDSIITHGAKNFTKEILFIFDNFDDMNKKESELVNKEFLKRPDVLNLIEGGQGTDFSGTMVCKYKGMEKYFRIPLAEFYLNRELLETSTEGMVNVIDDVGKVMRIPSDDYTSEKYDTPSSGKVSVINIATGETSCVLVSEVDRATHKPVFGGIVANIDGVAQYVSKEQFEKMSLRGIHKGKVTAKNKITGERKHIDKEEFNNNRQLYIHNTEGSVTGRHKITNEKRRFLCSEVDANRDMYTFSTSGMVTIFCTITNGFKNIPCDEYDDEIHHKSSDKKFLFKNKNGDMIVEFWGSKKLFVKRYGVSNQAWNQLIKGQRVSDNIKNEKIRGCYIELIDWKNELVDSMQ